MQIRSKLFIGRQTEAMMLLQPSPALVVATIPHVGLLA